MTTQQKMEQYEDAVLAWLVSRREFPTSPRTRPDAKCYGLTDDWVIDQAEANALKTFSKQKEL